MRSCPPGATLKHLLEVGDEHLEWPEVHAHVERCERCLRRLEELSDDPEINRLRVFADVEKDRVTFEMPAGLSLALESVDWGSKNLDGSLLETDDRSDTAATLRRFLGPYRLIRELGRGGMGTVYLAIDEALDREVAVKVLRGEPTDKRGAARFAWEARAAARVRHENVARIHLVAKVVDGPSYLVMELIKGISLRELIREIGPLPPRRAAALCAQAARGLAAAHEAGLVHRDVKPANILIRGVGPWEARQGQSPVTSTTAAPSEAAVLTDFGLARLADTGGSLTGEGVVLGTPAYMSPEHVTSPAKVDERSDVYSLGATLYECLTGESPFRGKPATLLKQLLHDEPRAPRRLNDAIPPALENVCLKAISKEPHRRYGSASAFAEDLDRFLEGRPVRARRAGLASHGMAWARRNPVSAGLAALLMIGWLGGSSGMFVLWRAAEASALESRRNLDQSRRSLAKATEAVDRFYTRVSQEKLLRAEGMHPLRQSLLNDAVGFYRELVRDHAEDRWIEGELAVASRRLAKLLMETASSEDALDAGLEALRLSQTLHLRLPDNPDLRHGIALCHVMLTHVYLKRGRLEDAFASTEAAIPLFRGLVKEFPGRVEYRVDLTGVLGNHGLALHGAKRLDQAREIWTSLADELEALVRLAPEFRAYRVQLATARNNLGIVTRGPEKIGHLRRALELRMELSGGSTGFALRDLAQTRKNLAMALATEGDFEESDRLFEAAVQDAERTLTANPKVPEFQFVMGSVLTAFASSLANRGRLAEARSSYESSLSQLETLLRDDPRHAPGRSELRSVLRNLGKLLHEIGDRASALALASRGRPFVGEDPEWWVEQVRHLARCLSKGDHPDDEPPTRDQVIEATAEAITLARQFGLKNTASLRDDPTLATIIKAPAIQKALAP